MSLAKKAGVNIVLPLSIIAMLVVSVAAQVAALLLMSHTKGLTAPLPTFGMFLLFMIGIGLMARVVNTGVNVSTVVPLVAAAIPLSSILIAIAFVGESASPLKISLLVSACGLVLAAGYMR